MGAAYSPDGAGPLQHRAPEREFAAPGPWADPTSVGGLAGDRGRVGRLGGAGATDAGRRRVRGGRAGGRDAALSGVGPDALLGRLGGGVGLLLGLVDGLRGL